MSGLIGCQAESVLVRWTGAHIPEFGDILRENTQWFVCGKKGFDGLQGSLAQRMPLLDAEDQYVGINKDGHSSVSLVDLFAADAFERKSG